MWNPSPLPTEATSVSSPYILFITTQNIIVVPRYDNGQIVIWENTPTDNRRKTIPAGLSEAWNIFLTSDEQIFVDHDTQISSRFFLCSDCDVMLCLLRSTTASLLFYQ
jgi:hypothetical protein